MANQKLNIDIIARDKATKVLGGLRGGLNKLKSSIFNVRNAFIGLGAGLVVRNLVNTGKQLENLQVRLKFLLKDTNEGAKAFENMTKFASKVPFSLEEIQSGSGILATVTDNAKDLQNMLEITGNVAAVTGLDFRTAAEQIQRSFSAGIGAADLFREKGVRNMLGFKAGATVSIEETVQAFQKVFGRDGQFGKATDDLANTFQGTLSMIGDKIFNFKKTLLEAGLFKELKRQFGDLDKFLESNGDKLDIIAEKIGRGLGIAFKKLSDTIIFLKENIDGVVTVLSGLIALKVALFFKGVTTAILGMTFAMNGFNLATRRNIIFGSIMVFASAMGFLINKFKEFKGELNEGVPTFKELNEDIAKLERQLKNSGKASKAALREQLKIKKLQLEELIKESGMLHMQNTTHMRNKQLQLGILNVQKEQTKELHKSFNIFESDRALVKAAKEAEERSLNRIIAANRNIFDEQQKIEKSVRGEGTLLEQVRLQLRKQNDEFSLTDEIVGFINKGIDSFSRGIAESLILGKNLKDTFKNMAKTLGVEVLSSLISIIAKKGVELAIEKLITREKQKQAALSGFSGGGSIFSMIGSFFGKKASGGAVSKGQPVVVGERGPEMFVPNSSGQITQSARGTGGGAVNVNFTINTIDSRGFDEALVENRATITGIINNALAEKGRTELV